MIFYSRNFGSGGYEGCIFTENTEQQDGCHNIVGPARKAYAEAAFLATRSQARSVGARARFAAKYPEGSTFEVTFPDGSIARYNVSAAYSTYPLTAEKPNSCT